MKTEVEVPTRLSYSSLSSYAECGNRWLLERGHGLNKSTWFATVAGSAIHEITEKVDLTEIGGYSGRIPSFKEEFDRRLKIEADRGIEVKPSGRKLKEIGATGGPNKRDYEWWLIYGPIYIENWQAWKAESEWHLAVMPNGSPGIEVVIRQQMARRDHLGFIDRVYITPEGEVVVVDLKSGNVPVSTLQLGSYRVGLLREHGLYADWGTYWMASDGQLAGLKDLTRYTPEYIDAQYEMAWRGIEAGVFLPNVTSMCVACGVRDYCTAVGGRLADELPPLTNMIGVASDQTVVSSAPGV